MKRDEAQLCAALRRIGSPVCLTTPESFREEHLYDPFLICIPVEERDGVFLGYGDHVQVAGGQPEFANAWEYAPDGTPLVDAGRADRGSN